MFGNITGLLCTRVADPVGVDPDPTFKKNKPESVTPPSGILPPQDGTFDFSHDGIRF